MSSSILSIRHVVKRYDKHIAVNDVSLEVPRGSVFGLLGPNGAGKTSLIRMITTITGPDEGEIWLDGERLNARSPEQIGYMPEERGLYKKMKVEEHLLYLARLKGMSLDTAQAEINRWFEKFDIASWANKAIEDLSKGMQQKVQFIATVLHRPKLLILDEPFTGLDPINTNLIKDEIKSLNESGISIIFSTHRMEQVEEMCDYIALINQGRNVLYGAVSDIRKQYKQNLFLIEAEGEWPADLGTRWHVVKRKGAEIQIQLEDDSRSNELLRYFTDAGMRILHYREIYPTFNEIFIRTIEQA